jgi:hypothetical protein
MGILKSPHREFSFCTSTLSPAGVYIEIMLHNKQILACPIGPDSRRARLRLHAGRHLRWLSCIALIAPVFGAAVATSTTSNFAVAAVAAPDLCNATGIDARPDDDTIGRGGCVYAAWDAPVLSADVCWDGKVAKIKGTAPCLGYSRAYHVRNGEVLDPQTGVVAAYAPLPNTCEIVACEPNFQEQPLEDGLACCDPKTGDCFAPDANGMCTVGDITWCKEVEKHNNGTVTCHE